MEKKNLAKEYATARLQGRLSGNETQFNGHEVFVETDIENAFNAGRESATASPWHSVAEGDLPKEDVWANHTLIVFGAGIGFEYDVQYIAEDKCFGFSIFNGLDEEDGFEVLDGVDYWMEIPELPE